MNLTTQTLLSQIGGHHPIAEFIGFWDSFEAAVIRIYKTGTLLEEDRRQLQIASEHLAHLYLRWERVLQPYWQESQIEGEPVRVDPFSLLLKINDPQTFIRNWQAMQTLPVAREAINRFLWEQIS